MQILGTISRPFKLCFHSSLLFGDSYSINRKELNRFFSKISYFTLLCDTLPDFEWESKFIFFVRLYLFYFIFLRFFWCWPFFLKVFIEFVTILLMFYVLVFWPWGKWDLSSPTRDWTCTPCIGRQRLNHWTTREVP